jgi:hypothetical protein
MTAHQPRLVTPVLTNVRVFYFVTQWLSELLHARQVKYFLLQFNIKFYSKSLNTELALTFIPNLEYNWTFSYRT